MYIWGTYTLPRKGRQDHLNSLSLGHLFLDSVHEEGLAGPSSHRAFITGLVMLTIASDNIKYIAGEFVKGVGFGFGFADDSNCFVLFNLEVVFGLKFYMVISSSS